MSAELVQRLGQLRIEAVDAAASLDWETAYQKLLAAKIILDTAPSEQERESMRMSFRDFESLMVRVQMERDKAAQSGKVKRINVLHTRPLMCDEY